VDNAIRYSHEGGQVRVEIGSDDREVTLRVKDTGIGIPSKDIPRVFERFYRVDRARSRETGGTGLGLAIVKHVVENHGGTIEVDSELGRGTTFTIRFPAATSV
jgi:two-component system phosphate regulon sensor histidine kinase PhoR